MPSSASRGSDKQEQQPGPRQQLPRRVTSTHYFCHLRSALLSGANAGRQVRRLDKFQRDFNVLFDVRDDGFCVTRSLLKLAQALQQ